MQSDGVRSPMRSQRVTSTFALSVFGLMDTQLLRDAFFKGQDSFIK